MMMKNLDEMLKLREIASDIANAGKSGGSKPCNRDEYNPRTKNVASIVASNKKKCVLCDVEGHYPNNCFKYKIVNRD